MGKRKVKDAENDGLRVEAFEWANKQNQLLMEAQRTVDKSIKKDMYSSIILSMSIGLLIFMIYEAYQIIQVLKMLQ